MASFETKVEGTVTITRIGTNQKYSSGWDAAFTGSKKKATKSSPAVAPKAAAPKAAAVKVAAAKKGAKKSAKAVPTSGSATKAVASAKKKASAPAKKKAAKKAGK